MEATLAQLFLGPVVSETLKKVSSIAAEQFSLMRGFKDELSALEETLTMIQAVIHDAERRQATDESVKLWLKRLHDVAYKADDVLDKCAYELLRHKVQIQNQLSREVRFFLPLLNQISFRWSMAHEIKKINISLNRINDDAIRFGIRREAANMAFPSIPETDSFLEDSEVVGRRVDTSTIIDMLITLNNEKDISIIPIVGMAGLGKTTLAKLIYNHERIKGHFDERIWVFSDKYFDVERLLKKVLASLTKEKSKTESRDVILQNLQDKLRDKRFLLVLDDVWMVDDSRWDDFKSCLSIASKRKGGTIVVTTCNEDVASIVGTLATYRLNKLSEDDCWRIFKKKAFGNRGVQITPDLMTVGKLIAAKCEGMPLAAKLAGTMLRRFKEKKEWYSILHNGLWAKSGVLSVLKWSFDNLPSSSIKKCFAFCSIFTEDFNIEREQLIQLWMALGFLQPCERKDIEEEIGNKYFNTLLQNSLFQDAEKDEHDNIRGCKMHALMHQLALSISKSESFSVDASHEQNEIPHVRHLAIYSGTETILEGQEEKTSNLRTLFFRSSLINCKFMGFLCLRILNLSFATIEELPTSISKLIHLRYLDLSETRVQVLPKSIGKLYYLQTLRLGNCDLLLRLPKELRNLINLRHLYLDGCPLDEMPKSIGRLIHLQTLHHFKVGKEQGDKIEELKDLDNLKGSLKIWKLENVLDEQEAQQANLWRKTNLCKLTFRWGDATNAGTNHEEVLKGLQPPSTLKGLEIENFGGSSFPEWTKKMAVSRGDSIPLHNLVTIKLVGCNKCDEIPMLGKLQLLQHLKLIGMDNVKCIGQSFYDHNDNVSSGHGHSDELTGPFPSLITFELRDMKNLEEWTVPAARGRGEMITIFPCLEELKIDNCPKLRSVPIRFPCLKKLEIQNCPKLETLPIVQQ